MSSENIYGLSKFNILRYFKNAQFNWDFQNIGILAVRLNRPINQVFSKYHLTHLKTGIKSVFKFIFPVRHMPGVSLQSLDQTFDTRPLSFYCLEFYSFISSGFLFEWCVCVCVCARCAGSTGSTFVVV